ncbi:hypothetical protein PCK1_000289 [Pneumocystis canis]|nr:hypothetical protein PCK1_000289 [Pneumocystis canis]
MSGIISPRNTNMSPYSKNPIQLGGYVGFDSITKQIERKLMKRGFQFNIICVGQTGLGKSTLINTLFSAHLIDTKGRLSVEEPIRQTTEIHTVSHLLEENGVHLKLNIIDTPGYGDLINNERWQVSLDQHSSYLKKELTAQRDRHIQDTRIHCCLFFIQPSGHSLKPIDIIVLKKLTNVVNVVPVIAKSDSLTLDERIINFLTRTHLQDLIETTALIHYENFRSRQLLALKESSAMGSGPRPITRGSIGDTMA